MKNENASAKRLQPKSKGNAKMFIKNSEIDENLCTGNTIDAFHGVFIRKPPKI